MFELMKCIAEGIAAKGAGAMLMEVPGGKFAHDVGAYALKRWREKHAQKKLEAAVKESIEAKADEAIAAARQAVAEAAPELTGREKELAVQYVAAIPEAARQTLKRKDDPTGNSLPFGYTINEPDDVAKVLPTQMPRFIPGEWVPGRQDNWRLERKLGGGGFGEVWLARHQFKRSEKPRAVKFCTDPAARTKLVTHEKDVVVRVMQHADDHPNIVALLEFNLSGATPWLMYEYAEGGTLADAIPGWQALAPADRLTRAVAVLHAIAGAVAHCHAADPAIVHRDLKPANVLMAGGVPRVIDFGIGGTAVDYLITEERTRGYETVAGRLPSMLSGSYSLLYSSPQQRAGDKPDPRDDVHALGVLAFQMLVGRVDAEVKGDWRDRLEDDGVPPVLVKLIGRSASDDVERRPKDAREWVAAISTMLPLKPVDEEEIPRISANTLGYLKAMKDLGATSPDTAVPKAELMVRFNLTATVPEDCFEYLIGSVETDRHRSKFEHLSKWSFYILPEGIKAIYNHVIYGRKSRPKESSDNGAETEEVGVWQGFWFVNVGESEKYDDNDEWIATNRSWDDCRKYGFLAAGYGEKYSKAMKKLELRAPVFAYMRGLGYVGYGEVTKEAVMARDFTPEGSTDSLLKLPLIGKALSHDADDEEQAEWVVGVRWHKTFDREEAKTFSGAFASQHIVCKLRQPETVEYLRKEFNVSDA